MLSVSRKNSTTFRNNRATVRGRPTSTRVSLLLTHSSVTNRSENRTLTGPSWLRNVMATVVQLQFGEIRGINRLTGLAIL